MEDLADVRRELDDRFCAVFLARLRGCDLDMGDPSYPLAFSIDGMIKAGPDASGLGVRGSRLYGLGVTESDPLF